MLTSINIANALATVAANVDVIAATQDNAIFATGYSNGSAVVNLGTASVNADFAASGSIAYDTANNRIQVEDGSFLALAQSINNAKFVLAAQGNVGGSLVLDPLSNTLTFGQGSTLGVDLGTRHIDITATDSAGGQLILGANGLTFRSAGGDGGLILSVTDGGQTRQALLNFAGEMTYALDGTINLTQGTVVNNVFADGNVLTITALTDAGGSMIFDPNGGLYITPSTSDALNVVLSTDGLNVATFKSITGTINYTGGIVTASDGTQADLTVYDIWETNLRTTGGTASIQFTADRTVYTANEGATFVLDYLDGTTTEIQNGSYADVYGENIEDYVELVSEGTTLRSNDETVVFTLATAGNYNLNGINVITTEDNVQLRLVNYNTVVVGDLAYTSLNEGSAIAIDDTGVVGINEVSVNPISLFMSADLAGDFLPNYEADFANALQIVDAGTFDALNEILPADNLGEISFNTQADELSQSPQLVIVSDK